MGAAENEGHRRLSGSSWNDLEVDDDHEELDSAVDDYMKNKALREASMVAFRARHFRPPHAADPGSASCPLPVINGTHGSDLFSLTGLRVPPAAQQPISAPSLLGAHLTEVAGTQPTSSAAQPHLSAANAMLRPTSQQGSKLLSCASERLRPMTARGSSTSGAEPCMGMSSGPLLPGRQPRASECGDRSPSRRPRVTFVNEPPSPESGSSRCSTPVLVSRSRSAKRPSSSSTDNLLLPSLAVQLDKQPTQYTAVSVRARFASCNGAAPAYAAPLRRSHNGAAIGLNDLVQAAASLGSANGSGQLRSALQRCSTAGSGALGGSKGALSPSSTVAMPPAPIPRGMSARPRALSSSGAASSTITRPGTAVKEQR